MWDLRLILVSSLVLVLSGRTTSGIYEKKLSTQPDAAFRSQSEFFRRDYSFIPHTKSFYKLHQNSLNWWGAKMRCEMEGAQLWIPETDYEVEIVTYIWRKSYPHIRSLFIGISDLISEGDFVTIDGRSIQNVYHRWMIYEPNNLYYKEDCVVMFRNGLMNDVSCCRHERFLCKKTLATLTWNFLCNVPDPNYFFIGDIGKCYKIHKFRKTWSEAYATCNAEESYLAVVNSQNEANIIAKMLNDSLIRNQTTNANLLLLGFLKEDDSEEWTTVQGATLQEAGFDKWAETRPNDYKYRYNRCGAFTYTGELYDVDCKSYQYFICEHDVDALSIAIDERFAETNNLV